MVEFITDIQLTGKINLHSNGSSSYLWQPFIFFIGVVSFPLHPNDWALNIACENLHSQGSSLCSCPSCTQTHTAVAVIQVIFWCCNSIPDVEKGCLVIWGSGRGEGLLFLFSLWKNWEIDRGSRGVDLQFSVLLLLIFRWSFLWIISVLSRFMDCLSV